MGSQRTVLPIPSRFGFKLSLVSPFEFDVVGANCPLQIGDCSVERVSGSVQIGFGACERILRGRHVEQVPSPASKSRFASGKPLGFCESLI